MGDRRGIDLPKIGPRGDAGTDGLARGEIEIVSVGAYEDRGDGTMEMRIRTATRRKESDCMKSLPGLVRPCVDRYLVALEVGGSASAVGIREAVDTSGFSDGGVAHFADERRKVDKVFRSVNVACLNTTGKYADWIIPVAMVFDLIARREMTVKDVCAALDIPKGQIQHLIMPAFLFAADRCAIAYSNLPAQEAFKPFPVCVRPLVGKAQLALARNGKIGILRGAGR